MLDDAAFDVERWLAQEIATEFARAEGAAFVADGRQPAAGLPGGADSAAADGVRPFGTLQFVERARRAASRRAIRRTG
jgi:HK97 family phage major capsid protein